MRSLVRPWSRGHTEGEYQPGRQREFIRILDYYKEREGQMTMRAGKERNKKVTDDLTDEYHSQDEG